MKKKGSAGSFCTIESIYAIQASHEKENTMRKGEWRKEEVNSEVTASGRDERMGLDGRRGVCGEVGSCGGHSRGKSDGLTTRLRDDSTMRRVGERNCAEWARLDIVRGRMGVGELCGVAQG